MFWKGERISPRRKISEDLRGQRRKRKHWKEPYDEYLWRWGIGQPLGLTFPQPREAVWPGRCRLCWHLTPPSGGVSPPPDPRPLWHWRMWSGPWRPFYPVYYPGGIPRNQTVRGASWWGGSGRWGSMRRGRTWGWSPPPSALPVGNPWWIVFPVKSPHRKSRHSFQNSSRDPSGKG